MNHLWKELIVTSCISVISLTLIKLFHTLLPVLRLFAPIYISIVLTGFAAPARTQVVTAVDSIRLLDSLVNYYKVSNNPMSVKFAVKALAVARRSNSSEKLVDAYKMLGIAYFQNQKDSSF